MTLSKTPDALAEEKAALRDDIARCDAELRRELTESERKYHERERNLAIARLWSLGSTTSRRTP